MNKDKENFNSVSNKSIDDLFKMLTQEQQNDLIYCLNKGKEKAYFFDDGTFIGVHVYASHLTVTDKQTYWSKGYINGNYTKTK